MPAGGGSGGAAAAAAAGRPLPLDDATSSSSSSSSSKWSSSSSTWMAGAVVAVGAATLVACQAAFLVHPPGTYMDEIFHVRQTQTYCQGRFWEWDKKITTLPGVYLVVALAHVPLLQMFTSQPCESVPLLRLVNLFFSLGTLFIMVKMLQARMGELKALAHATTLWLYPPSFFFTFLLYTDPGSTFLVLSTLWLVQEGTTHHILKSPGWRLYLASLTGAAAIVFRQTNVVWCAFGLGDAMLRQVLLLSAAAHKRSSDVDTTTSPADTPHTTAAAGNNVAEQLQGPLTAATVPHFALAALRRGGALLQALWPLLAPLLSFVAFVIANGSIVVGDKGNHRFSPHLAQLAYAAAAAASMHLSPFVNDGMLSTSALRQFSTWARHRFSSPARTAAMAVALVAAAAALARFSVAHPFVLSDNRHYTFYAWRRWLGRGAPHRIALLPAYTYAAWLVLSRVSTARCQLWALMLAAAAALVLVPSPLLEPRYFTVPVLLAHLNSPQRPAAALLSTALACAAVNVGTVWVFLYRPFEWPDGSVARFMW